MVERGGPVIEQGGPSVESSQADQIFWSIDFDRCLADTEAIFTDFFKLLEQHANISVHDMREAQQKVQETGGSFDVMRYLEEQIDMAEGSMTLERIKAEFIERGKSKDYLMPGATEYLDSLQNGDVPHGIVTYGGDDWQRLKIEAAGLVDMPLLVVDNKYKGAVLSSWLDEQGKVVPPPELNPEGRRFDMVGLVDDKAQSFNHFPDNAVGFHVVPSRDEMLPSQMGELPPGGRVKEIEGLVELAKLHAGDGTWQLDAWQVALLV